MRFAGLRIRVAQDQAMLPHLPLLSLFACAGYDGSSNWQLRVYVAHRSGTLSFCVEYQQRVEILIDPRAACPLEAIKRVCIACCRAGVLV